MPWAARSITAWRDSRRSRRGTEVQKIMAHREQPVPPIAEHNQEVENLFADIIEKRMLAKRPEDRYQTPAEVAAALEPWMGGASRAFNVLDLLEEVVQQDAASARPLETVHGWDTYREYSRIGEKGPLATRPVTLLTRIERRMRHWIVLLADTLIAGSTIAVVALILMGYWHSQRSTETTVADQSKPTLPVATSQAAAADVRPSEQSAPAAARPEPNPPPAPPPSTARASTTPASAASPPPAAEPTPQPPASRTVGSKFRWPPEIEWSGASPAATTKTTIRREAADGSSIPRASWSASVRSRAG